MKIWLPTLLTLILAGACSSGGKETVTLLGAVSTANALTEVAELYEAQTGRSIRLGFASSSTAARQIEAGAKTDIFVSANVDWVNYLEERNLIEPKGKVDLLHNRLVLVAGPYANQKPITDLKVLPQLKGPVAMGDPHHVPAGIYAREALDRAGWSPEIQPMENVRAALRVVALGEVPLGVVYATDVARARVTTLVMFPEESHSPIRYPAVLVRDASPQALDFFNFLQSDEARLIFRRHGFGP